MTGPECTAHERDPNAYVAMTTMEPCGCDVVIYSDGTVCREHAHLVCDGTPVPSDDQP